MSYVICGFSGVGKSTAEQKHKDVFDFESSAFSHRWQVGHMGEKNEEFPRNYVDALCEHMDTHHRAIYLISCHQEVRDELKKRGIEYIIVMPHFADREEYLKRWLRRGSSMEFITSMYERWSEMVNSCEKDNSPKIHLAENEYINDVLPLV
ncbi:MAG: hypothetical protein U0M60_14325 [Clostridia bacterium]|nr:hypothetical protein [Clostridia bacterium]